MKFNKVCTKPKFKGYRSFLLLKTPDYSESGFVIGYFDEEFYSESSDEAISEYVTEWAYLN